MRCTCRRHAVLSAVLDDSQAQQAVAEDDQGTFCPVPLDAADNHLRDSITRAEIMNYLSQTYGPAFVEELGKHLPQPGDGQEQMTRHPRSTRAQDGHREPTTATI